MKAKDLFTIILKVFGIYLIKDVLLAIPPVLNEVYQIFQVSGEMAFFSLIFSVFVFGLHFAIVYLLLFKTGFIISKLNLASDLSDDSIRLDMHRSSIFTIAIIISGLVILAFAIPKLIKQLYFWYEYMNTRKSMFSAQSYDYSGLLIAIAEVIIGLLFLGNQRAIVNYIEFRRRKENGG